MFEADDFNNERDKNDEEDISWLVVVEEDEDEHAASLERLNVRMIRN